MAEAHSHRRKTSAIIALLAVAGFGFPAGNAVAYEQAGVIQIWGVEMLATSPFLRGGDGSPGNPYVISGWERDLTTYGNGTEISGIAAHVVIRGNHFFADGYGAHAGTTYGVEFDSMTNLTIEGNLIEKMRYAVMMTTYTGATYSEENLRILNNSFVNNTFGGIRILHARNVTITGNLIEGTGGAPVALLESTDSVRVHHNNFANNSAAPVDEAGSANAWDDGYPSGGNYWDDYAGVDNCKGAAQDDCSGSDGIGDTPYVIDGDSQDRYPLMGPFVAPNIAPVAAFSISPPVAEVNETVTLDGSQSADPEDGAAGLQFRWDLDGDGAWDTARASSATTSTTFAEAGTHTISLEVSDADGAAANLTKTVLVVDPALPDPHPAEVTASAPAQVETGGAIVVQVEVSDAEGVATVEVVYQAVGASSFSHIEMAHSTGNLYTATLPAQTAAGELVYYVLVTDAQGHQTRDPPQGNHSLRVNPVAVAAGGDSLAFVLAGVLVATVGVALLVRKRRPRAGP